MHGLIFETSIWLLAGSTRLLFSQLSLPVSIARKENFTGLANRSYQNSYFPTLPNGKHRKTVHWFVTANIRQWFYPRKLIKVVKRLNYCDKVHLLNDGNQTAGDFTHTRVAYRWTFLRISLQLTGDAWANFPLALLLLLNNRVKYSDESIFCSAAQVFPLSATWKTLRRTHVRLHVRTSPTPFFVLSRFQPFSAIGLAKLQASKVQTLVNAFLSPYEICHISHKKIKYFKLIFWRWNCFAEPKFTLGKVNSMCQENFFFLPKIVTNVTTLTSLYKGSIHGEVIL